MTARQQHNNGVLAALMSEAGLSPRSLAREINRLAGAGTVAETAPYHWRDAGGVPRDPLPGLTAYILSRHLGRIVTVGDLWQGRAADATLFLPADVGMGRSWTPASTVAFMEDWLLGGLLDRRVFLSVTGAALTRAVGVYLAAKLPAPAMAVTADDDPIVDQIEATVPQLQLLDDERGGASGLDYVGVQARAAMLVLRQSGYAAAVNRRLLVAIADLTQLAGWMAFDAGRHGLAQRYFFTGLRAANDAGYRSMQAHILADLSFQAASQGLGNDAVALGEAAQRVAHGTARSVRASVSSRRAYAYASAGRIADCERAWHESRDHFEQSAHEPDPAWMYYLTPNHLDCQAGYAMVHAGRAIIGDDRTTGRSLLRKGESLLRSGVYDRPPTAPSQRRALYEGSWLALSYTSYGDLGSACDVVRLALPRLHQVRSPRSVELLKTLAHEFRRRRRDPRIAELLPELTAALDRQRSHSVATS